MKTATLKLYVLGFALSLLLTGVSFGSLALHIHTGHTFPTHVELTVVFLAAALLQLFVQLIFFLHIHKNKTGWNNVALGFAAFIVIVIVGGSLWIMHNLQHGNLGNIFTNEVITPQNEQD